MRGWRLTNFGLLAGRWPRGSRCALSSYALAAALKSPVSQVAVAGPADPTRSKSRATQAVERTRPNGEGTIRNAAAINGSRICFKRARAARSRAEQVADRRDVQTVKPARSVRSSDPRPVGHTAQLAPPAQSTDDENCGLSQRRSRSNAVSRTPLVRRRRPDYPARRSGSESRPFRCIATVPPPRSLIAGVCYRWRRFASLDGGRRNTILATRSSMAPKYTVWRSSGGLDASSEAPSAKR